MKQHNLLFFLPGQQISSTPVFWEKLKYANTVPPQNTYKLLFLVFWIGLVWSGHDYQEQHPD